MMFVPALIVALTLSIVLQTPSSGGVVVFNSSVVYESANSAIVDVNCHGDKLNFQSDGNLVLLTPRGPKPFVWDSQTYARVNPIRAQGTTVTLEDDGQNVTKHHKDLTPLCSIPGNIVIRRADQSVAWQAFSGAAPAPGVSRGPFVGEIGNDQRFEWRDRSGAVVSRLPPSPIPSPTVLPSPCPAPTPTAPPTTARSSSGPTPAPKTSTITIADTLPPTPTLRSPPTTTPASSMPASTSKSTPTTRLTSTSTPTTITTAPLTMHTMTITGVISNVTTTTTTVTGAISNVTTTTTTTVIAMPASPASDNVALIGGIVGGVVALLLIIGLIAFIVIRRKRQRRKAGNSQQSARNDVSMAPAQPSPSNYGNITVLRASNDYDETFLTKMPAKGVYEDGGVLSNNNYGIAIAQANANQTNYDDPSALTQ